METKWVLHWTSHWSYSWPLGPKPCNTVHISGGSKGWTNDVKRNGISLSRATRSGFGFFGLRCVDMKSYGSKKNDNTRIILQIMYWNFCCIETCWNMLKPPSPSFGTLSCEPTNRWRGFGICWAMHGHEKNAMVRPGWGGRTIDQIKVDNVIT